MGRMERTLIYHSDSHSTPKAQNTQKEREIRSRIMGFGRTDRQMVERPTGAVDRDSL